MKYFFLLLIFAVQVACNNGHSQGAVNPGDSSPTPSPPSSDGSNNGSASTSTAENGPWGGNGIHMDVGATQSVYELDCAHGTIDQPLQGDANGNFKVQGQITLESGGPVHPGEHMPTFSATFSERFNDSQMTMNLDYTNASSENVHNTYELTHGVAGSLHKCLRPMDEANEE